MHKLTKFACLSRDERSLFLEAVSWCALIRLILMLIPFRKYNSLLGIPQNIKQSKRELPPPKIAFVHLKQLEQIGAAIRRASRYVPWETRCFVEAITAKRMLKRRKIPSTIYLGLKKTTNADNGGQREDLRAHAWIACGDFIITGRQGAQLNQYTVITAFE